MVIIIIIDDGITIVLFFPLSLSLPLSFLPSPLISTEEGGGDEGVINEQFHDDSNCITEAMETIESLRKEIEKYKVSSLHCSAW